MWTTFLLLLVFVPFKLIKLSFVRLKPFHFFSDFAESFYSQLLIEGKDERMDTNLMCAFIIRRSEVNAGANFTEKYQNQLENVNSFHIYVSEMHSSNT